MSRAHECVYKVVLVGSYSVGKTSLFWRLKTGQFMEHHEAGDAASSLSVTDRCTVSYVMRTGTVVQLDVWDTVGMERQSRLPHNYYRTAHAVVLVYDTTLFDSLSLLSRWLDDVNLLPPETLRVLMGSKCDLPSEISQELVDAFMDENRIDLHFNVSAKEDSGTDEAFEAIAWTLYRQDQACPLKDGVIQGELEESRTMTGLAVSGRYHSLPSHQQRGCCSSS